MRNARPGLGRCSGSLEREVGRRKEGEETDVNIKMPNEFMKCFLRARFVPGAPQDGMSGSLRELGK